MMKVSSEFCPIPQAGKPAAPIKGGQRKEEKKGRKKKGKKGKKKKGKKGKRKKP